MRVLLVVAALAASPALGAKLYWRGANTEFANAANWEDGNVPGAQPGPASTNMRTSKPFSSFVPEGTYNVGSMLKLPRNGRLTFSGEAGAVTTIKFSNTGTGSEAVFIGGQVNNAANDFSCRQNWETRATDGTAVVAQRAPCLSDDVIFDTSVRIWTDQDQLNIDSLAAGGAVFTETSANLPQYMFDALDGLLNIDEGLASCLHQSADGECICPNSCPDGEEEQRDEDERQRNAQENKAQKEIDAGNVLIAITFEGAIAPSVLGTDIDTLEAHLASGNNKNELMAALELALAEAWGVSSDNVTLTELATNQEGQVRLVLNGRVVGPASLFTEAGGELAKDGDTLVLDIDETGGRQLSAFLAALRKVFADLVNNDLVSDLGRQISAACTAAAPEACDGLVDALDMVAMYFKDPRSVYDAICPSGQCLASGDSIVQALDGADLSKQGESLSADALAQAKAAIAGALAGVDMTQTPNFEAAVKDVLDAASDLNDAGTKYTPVGSTFNAPPMAVGTLLPENDLYMLLNTDNYEAVAKALENALEGVAFIEQPKVTQLSLTREARRRRATGDPSHIEVKFDYLAFCQPGDTVSCRITGESTDPVRQAVISALNNALATFDIITHPCLSITDGWDQACLVKLAERQLAAGKTRAQVNAMLSELLECDYRGRSYDSDECWFPNLTQDDDVNSVSSAAKSPAKSSSGGAGGVGMIAGIAAACVVLIVLVIVLVVRRRKQQQGGAANKKANTDDRTVVAFENPMYDDPAQNQAQPMYDDATGDVAGGDNEGLYDEPAFNQGANIDKSNPLYESTENIAGADAGYLDAAPAEGAAGGAEGEEGGGYLDVAPDEDE